MSRKAKTKTPNPADQALLHAIAKSDLRAVCRALDAGANPNIQDEIGTPCLLVGTRFHASEKTWSIVEELIRAGADATVKGENQESIFHHAARVDRTGIFDLVDDLDVDVRDGYGRTPLHDAAAFGSLEVVEMLLDCGADPWASSDPDAPDGPDYLPIDAIDFDEPAAYHIEFRLQEAMNETEGDEEGDAA